MNQARLTVAVAGLFWIAQSAIAAEDRLSVPEHPDSEAAVIWHVPGHRVEVLRPRVVTAEGTVEFSVVPDSSEQTSNTVQIRYVLRGTDALANIRGHWTLNGQLDPGGSALRMEEQLQLEEPATVDLRVTVRYRVTDEQAVSLVTEDTQIRPLDFYSGIDAIYTRGAIAHGLAPDRTATAAFRFVDRSTDKVDQSDSHQCIRRVTRI